MASARCYKTVRIIFTLVVLIASSISSAFSMPNDILDSSDNHLLRNQTIHLSQRVQKSKRIRRYLRRINKLAIKTIEWFSGLLISICLTSLTQSPDGDLIDCVPSHLQPAFDHPLLKGLKPLRPTNHGWRKSIQLWTDSGESCPDGTVPIRRTTMKDVLRAGSLHKFGRKSFSKQNTKISSNDQLRPVGDVTGDCYSGARLYIHVWKANETDQYDFRLSQVWMASGNSTSNDLNTVEAGWQVNPKLFGDNSPRFFTYWTADSYGTTGCYNLLCSGFVQTNNRISLGAAISPRFSQNGRELDIGIPMIIAKDAKHGHWWLEIGPGIVVGYWPSLLFSRLHSHANMVQFGGIMVKARSMGLNAPAQITAGDISVGGVGKATNTQDLEAAEALDKLVPLCSVGIFARQHM
ncbi:protein neprosin-like [Coffea arabica]|uniref:Protein neprosin-like n=1 Tax=Coffea arabica TaxID=13443 RepID=A0ABM4U5J7_COFAR